MYLNLSCNIFKVILSTLSKVFILLQYLRIIILSCWGRSRNLSPLTMRLQGNIDAAVNGGVAKYRSAFFSPEGGGGGAAAEAGAGQLVELLAGQLEEQAQLLGEVLQLHGQLAPEPLQVTLTFTDLLSSQYLCFMEQVWFSFVIISVLVSRRCANIYVLF